MAHFLFIDESGQDHKASPYEVLAGVAIEDRDLWNLIKAIQDSEQRNFGRRYSLGPSELKGKKLLDRKVFRKAAQLPLMPERERSVLAKRCLDGGSTAGKHEINGISSSEIGLR
jgi:hypothetical protein